MKQMTEYNRVSGYLNKLFDKLNARYFESALSKPVITIQNTPKAYGHVSVFKIWRSGEENRHELNIGAGTLARPIEETVATLIHEMVHLFCMQNNIQDTSRGGTYHNKRFKEEAERRGLIIDHIPTYGYTKTTPSEELIKWCIENNLEEIKCTRCEVIPTAKPGKSKAGESPDSESDEAPAKKKSSTRKYTCPCCRVSVRATKDLSLICGECYKKDANIHYLTKEE